ncbi:hypothetical protein [Borreliella tanukii]
MRLGSNRAKQLINLFRKVKTRISDSMFETEVFCCTYVLRICV